MAASSIACIAPYAAAAQAPASATTRVSVRFRSARAMRRSCIQHRRPACSRKVTGTAGRPSREERAGRPGGAGVPSRSSAKWLLVRSSDSRQEVWPPRSLVGGGARSEAAYGTLEARPRTAFRIRPMGTSSRDVHAAAATSFGSRRRASSIAASTAARRSASPRPMPSATITSTSAPTKPNTERSRVSACS